MIYIHSKIVNEIESVVFYYNDELSYYEKNKIFYVNNNTDKDEIILLFQNCVSFTIEDTEIKFIIPRNIAEIEAIHEHRLKYLTYSVNRLKKQIEKYAEDKQEVYKYLKLNNLDYIIKLIKE